MEKLTANIEALKLRFADIITESQDMGVASQQMCIEIKRECMNLILEFKHQMDDIGRLRQELERL